MIDTVTKAEAKALAKSAFGGKKPEGPQKHGGDKPGYLNPPHKPIVLISRTKEFYRNY